MLLGTWAYKYRFESLLSVLQGVHLAVQLLDCVVFPSGACGQEPACQCRSHTRCGFDPWAGKIPLSRKWQPAPVFLPGESHRQKGWRTTVHRVTKCQTGLKQLSTHTHGNFMLNILQNCLSVFHNSCTILHSCQQNTRVPAFPHPHHFLLLFSHKSHPRGCEVVFHSGSNLHFPNDFRFVFTNALPHTQRTVGVEITTPLFIPVRQVRRSVW